MATSLLFPTAIDLDPGQHALLAEAYELACDELVRKKAYTPEQLEAALEPMTTALLTLFRAGQWDAEQLGRYAVSKAVKTNRWKSARR